jgi:hypothetical protein
MLVDGSYKSLLQGISQQPDRVKAAGQVNAMVNMIADPIDGLKRRPPVTHIKNAGTYHADNLTYGYDTGTEQYYCIFNHDKTISVFDWNGVVKTVNNQGAAYLSTTPKVDLSLSTIGDYTLVANRTKVCALTADVKAAVSGALLYFRDGGEYGRKYQVTLDNAVVATYTTPGGDTPATQAAQTGTEYVATAIYNALVASAPVGYSFSRKVNVILVKRTSGTTAINIQVSDDRGGVFAIVIQDTVTKASNLPLYALPGMVVTNTGAGTSDKDDVYMEAIGTGTELIEVVWRETVKRGLKYKFDITTMPHALVRLADGTFYFGPLNGGTYGTTIIETWRERDAGDEDSNPARAFIGSKIEFLASFQDRLLLLTDEFCVLSSTKSFFNFWNTTAVALLDSDPIEVANPSTKATALKAAVIHNKNLIVFAYDAQFVLPGGNKLTPALAALQQVTSYQANLGTTPVTAGSNVMFDITYGAYSGIRELFTGTLTDAQDSRALTDHVKKLLVGSVRQMHVGSNLGFLGVLTSGSPYSLYLYQYIWNGETRVQSAWSEWNFRAPICDFYFDQSNLSVLVADVVNNTYAVCIIDMTDVAETGLAYNVYLDRKGTAIPDVNRQFTIAEFTPLSASDLVVIQLADCAYPGLTTQVESLVGNVVTLKNTVGGTVMFGFAYHSYFEPTMPILKDQNDVVVGTNALMINAFNISYRDSGYFEVDVNDPWNGVSKQIFTSMIVGGIDTKVGEQPIITGNFNAGIGKNRDLCSVRIGTMSHLPMKIIDIEWTGQFTKKGRRF